MTIKQLFVAGAGLMGAGIAQTAISCGYEVSLREVDEALVNRGAENITATNPSRLTKLRERYGLAAMRRSYSIVRPA